VKARKSSFDIDIYVETVEAEFRRHANEKRAAASKAYVRDQFDYYGLTTPERRDVQKVFHEANVLPPFEAVPQLVKILWSKPQRELQYFAMELYEKYKKEFSKKDIPLFEYMIRNKSWWETVDFISPKLVAALLLKHPELQEETCERWMNSDHLWLMRAAIIHQNLYKKKTNEQLLFRLILQASAQEDFFIRKAIGWSLRQYGRTNPAAVKAFIKKHRDKLSPLSYKEANKHL
jgi:3-methyladenine DNA glycosylase AlkD